MYKALAWCRLPEGTYEGVMRWNDDAAWKVSGITDEQAVMFCASLQQLIQCCLTVNMHVGGWRLSGVDQVGFVDEHLFVSGCDESYNLQTLLLPFPLDYTDVSRLASSINHV